MDPFQLLPLSFYLSLAIGIGAVLLYLAQRRKRGDDDPAKLDL